jgi:hypothetical protein
VKKYPIIIIFALLFFPGDFVFSQMQSPSYKIPTDSVSVGGTRQSSDSFYSQESIGEMGTGESKSAHYINDAGFWAMVGDEEVLTFAITDDSADLGTLSTGFVRYDTAGFRAATTSEEGYAIEFFGNPLGFESNIIDPLSSGGGSNPGSEQFGFNLRQNSNPTVGVDPDGGNGQAASGYGSPNSYKFNSGDIIAQSSQPSVYTDYTASFIGNISNISDAGDYSANLTVVITGRF